VGVGSYYASGMFYVLIRGGKVSLKICFIFILISWTVLFFFVRGLVWTVLSILLRVCGGVFAGILYYVVWSNARSVWFWDLSYGLCCCGGLLFLCYLWHCWVGSVLLTFFVWGLVWFVMVWMSEKYELWLSNNQPQRRWFFFFFVQVARLVYRIRIFSWPYLDRVEDWYLRCIHDGLKFHLRVNFMIEKAVFSFLFSACGIVGIFVFVPSFISEGLLPL